MQFVFGSKEEQPWWWCRKAQFESQKILYRVAWCVMPGLEGRGRGLVGLAAGPIKTLHVCNSALKAKTLPQARLDLMMMISYDSALMTQWPKLSGRNPGQALWCQVVYKAARAVLASPPTLTVGLPAQCYYTQPPVLTAHA